MATSYFIGLSGDTHYIKPIPLVPAPWGDDVIAASESGTTGLFSATTDDSLSYVAYRQVGGSPADTDVIAAIIPNNPITDVATGVTAIAGDVTAIASDVTAVAGEVGKIPRRSGAIAAGAAYSETWTNDENEVMTVEIEEA